jgi:hypothetical protein
VRESALSLALRGERRNRRERVSGGTVQDVAAIPPVFANKYYIYVNRTSQENSKSRTICLPFVGNYRTFLMTPGMPTSDEFSNLYTLSRSYANSVY